MLKKKIWLILLVAAGASLAFAQKKTGRDFTGLWKFEDGVVAIVQNGSSLKGKMEKVSKWRQKNYGWKNGDPSFEGKLKGDRLSGRMRVLYHLDLKAKCGIWEKWVPFRATVAQDSITGQWWSETVTAHGCRITEANWEDYTMTRMEQK